MKDNELDQIIEKSLCTEPDFHLPVDFVQKVVTNLARREQWKTDLLEYLSITGILIFLLTIVSGTYYLVNKELLLKAYAFFSDNVVPVILVIFLINFILFTDRVLLRLLFSRWNRT
jgi:hypothetical protein